MSHLRYLKRAAVVLASHTGIWPILSGLAGDSLRVLLYHRVCDPAMSGFFGLKSNVSATPSQFERQIEYLSRHYVAVSLEECLAWIYEAKPLPPRALLITFDDGYRDNLTSAAPVLAAYDIPPVLFAATSCLDNQSVFFWDWAAEAFRQSSARAAALPLLGERSWTPESADLIAHQWVQAAAPLNEEDRSAAMTSLSEVLKYRLYEKAPAGTYLSWTDLAEMRHQGWTIGAHTVSHPMMLGLPIERAEQEIAMSKAILEEKLGTTVLSFAFPFGSTTAYDRNYVPILARSGLQIAFCSTGGINFAAQARQSPFELRRRTICLDDRLEHVAAWASGVLRLRDHKFECAPAQ